jgi:hypothetical protein
VRRSNRSVGVHADDVAAPRRRRGRRRSEALPLLFPKNTYMFVGLFEKLEVDAAAEGVVVSFVSRSPRSRPRKALKTLKTANNIFCGACKSLEILFFAIQLNQ